MLRAFTYLLCLIIAFVSSGPVLASDTAFDQDWQSEGNLAQLPPVPGMGTRSGSPTLAPLGPPIIAPSNDPAIKPAAPENLSDAYLLGPGDILTITDFTVPEGEKPFVSQEVIGPDGSVNINPVGVLKAGGLTLRGLNELANRMAELTMARPEIRISLTKPRPVDVYVLGDVVHPGLVSTDSSSFTNRTATQLSAGNVITEDSGTSGGGSADQSSSYREIIPRVIRLTVLTAIQLAGGLKDTANIYNVRVTRASTGEVLSVNLYDLLARGDARQDLVLRPGDTVFVERGGPEHESVALGLASDRQRRVRVYGEFKKPGIYDLKPEDDINSVIAKAGGFTENAITGSVVLNRVNRDGQEITRRVKLAGRTLFRGERKPSAVARVNLRDGDTIVADQSAAKIYLPRATTVVLTTLGAILLLYLSRNIVDRSQSTTSTVRLF